MEKPTTRTKYDSVVGGSILNYFFELFFFGHSERIVFAHPFIKLQRDPVCTARKKEWRSDLDSYMNGLTVLFKFTSCGRSP